MPSSAVRSARGSPTTLSVTGLRFCSCMGLTSSRQRWDPVTDLLAPDFTCVRVDLRGHGESSTAPDYGMQALVGDLRAVTDDLGIEEPAVVGHSLGAFVAAVFAAFNPVS